MCDVDSGSRLRTWLSQPKVPATPVPNTEPCVEEDDCKLMCQEDDPRGTEQPVHTVCDVIFSCERAQMVCKEHACSARRVMTRREFTTEKGFDRVESIPVWMCSKQYAQSTSLSASEGAGRFSDDKLRRKVSKILRGCQTVQCSYFENLPTQTQG